LDLLGQAPRLPEEAGWIVSRLKKME